MLSIHAPPTTGPVTVPMAHEARTAAKYLGRWRRGTMSQNIILVRDTMPPPPAFAISTVLVSEEDVTVTNALDTPAG